MFYFMPIISVYSAYGKESKMINVAILGFGVVGSGVAEVLTQNKKIIEDRLSTEVNIKYILDLREFPESPFGDLIIHDFNIILNDPDVNIVAEMMGGSHPAYDFSKAALIAGKSVVTSNKEVVANFGSELLSIAKAHNVAYLFEASVGGGIPIIRPMCNDLASNNITEISGILNGTTNYILTKMARDGVDFDTVLKEAQEKGYAERNPSADVDGLDAARKIVILSALAFGKAISPNDIHTEGITSITSDDVEAAASLGYSIKLIGYTSKEDEKIIAMVSPRLIPYSNPLSSINDVFNGILLNGDMVGDVMFYGPGAGKLPTASAVCADIVDIIAHRNSEIKLPEFAPATQEDIACFDGYTCRRFFLFEKCPSCVLDKETAEKCFGKIELLEIISNRVAVITAPMDEKTASSIVEKLNNCKTYRLL